MRISDWSSDVCSSDLAAFAAGPGTSQQEEAMSGQKHAAVLPTEGRPWEEIRRSLLDAKRCDYNWREGRLPLYVYYNDEALLKVSREARSEERRGGKECVSTCRSRVSPNH